MARPDGLIELPNGSMLYYDDAAHAYYKAVPTDCGWRRSTRLTGASTLSKPFSYDSGRLLAWKERMTIRGVVELVEQGHQVESIESVYRGLKEAALLADDHRDRKATIGTNVHSVLEGLAGIGPLPNLDEIPEEEKGYARAVFRWWEERRPEVLNCEQFVYSSTHGYAGRFDLRAELGEPVNFMGGTRKHVYLIDLKTSGFISPAHHVQLALYALAAYECGVGACDELLILQVKEDGSWKEIPCKATEADAIAAIHVYRNAARIEREAKAA